jgi:hypothetical protein
MIPILLSIVVIGRDEGARLSRCLESVRNIDPVGGLYETIYADSGSTDGSPLLATALGARVVDVKPERPCAAAGRNAGWRAARGRFVLFLDGDTVLDPAFPAVALQAFAADDVAVVFGHRRELHPRASLYNRVLDLDWRGKPGDAEYCGGDAMMRRDVLARSGGYDETLIAGEEPELCRRLRAAGHRIVHNGREMTGHDLALVRASQYLRRAFRTGHAYAEVARRFSASADPLWRSAARRNLVHAIALVALPLLALAVAAWTASPLPLAAGLTGIIALMLRSAWRARWRDADALTLLAFGVHSHVQQLPIAAGQLAFHRDRMRGSRRGLIDYKAYVAGRGPGANSVAQ